MKLGVAYSAFNGIELLPCTIKQIRNQVDFILVNYQEISYYGNPIEKINLEILYDLKKQGLVDQLKLHTIDKPAKSKDEAQMIEADKRNISRIICKENGCTHFLDLDCDEFYKEDEFIKAKKYIEDNLLDYTIVEYINYFKEPIFQVERDPKNLRYVPFICSIGTDNIVCSSTAANRKSSSNISISVDKTRFYETKERPFLFNHNNIMMHHMTGVRINLKDKYDNYSGRYDGLQNNLDHVVKQIKSLNKNHLVFDKKFKDTLFFNHNLNIKIVDNIFGIPVFDGV